MKSEANADADGVPVESTLPASIRAPDQGGEMRLGQPLRIASPDGPDATALIVEREAELALAIAELELPDNSPTLVLVGGADGMSESESRSLQPLFDEALVPAAEARGAVVLDGGTDTGVMRLMGQARSRLGASFPLVGVVVARLASLPGLTSDGTTAHLEPRHTHFVLVPGRSWGDEGPWLARLAGVLTRDAPSLTILVNGGELSWSDVARSVGERRPVLVIAGSGRTADRLAAACRGEPADRRAGAIIASGLVHAADLRDRAGITAAVRTALTR